MTHEIKIPRAFAVVVLWLSQFFDDRRLVLVCRGYDGDDADYTGLYWEEDKSSDLSADDAYSNFRLWINFKSISK